MAKKIAEKEESYTKKIGRSSIIVLISIVIAAFFSYLFRIVIARNMEVEEYGLFYAVLSVVVFFTIFRDLGLGEAVSRFIPIYNLKKQSSRIKFLILLTASFQVFMAVIISLILVLLSGFLAGNYFKNPLSSTFLILLCLMFIFTILVETLKSTFRGFQMMNHYSAMEIVQSIVLLLLTLFFFKIGFGVFSPVMAYVVSSPITFFVFVPFFLNAFPFFKTRFKYYKNDMKSHFSYGIPLIFMSLGSKSIWYVDIFFLTYFASLTDVGLFNIVMPTATLFLLFGRSIALVLLPAGSEILAKNKEKKLSDGLAKIQKYAFIVMAPLVFILFSFPDLFIKLLFGNEYVGGALALQIVLVGIIFFTIFRINQSVISSTGKTKIVAKIYILTAILNLIGCIILIPLYGLVGAAAITSISYMFSLFLSNYELSKLIKIKILWSHLIKIFICGLVFTALIFYLKGIINLNVWMELFAVAVPAATVYVALIFLFKVITFKEVKVLFDRILL